MNHDLSQPCYAHGEGRKEERQGDIMRDRAGVCPPYMQWMVGPYHHQPIRESGNVGRPSVGLLQRNRRRQLQARMHARGGSAVVVQRSKIRVSLICSCFGASHAEALPPYILWKDVS